MRHGRRPTSLPSVHSCYYTLECPHIFQFGITSRNRHHKSMISILENVQIFSFDIRILNWGLPIVASIHKEIEIERSQQFVWDAVRDVGAIHKRLVPGVVTDCKLEGDWRIVTFANGMTARELIVSVDDQTFRHSWAAQTDFLTHYNASLQVFSAGDNRSKVVWIADLMPNEVASTVGEMIQHGLETMKQTLEK